MLRQVKTRISEMEMKDEDIKRWWEGKMVWNGRTKKKNPIFRLKNHFIRSVHLFKSGWKWVNLMKWSHQLLHHRLSPHPLFHSIFRWFVCISLYCEQKNCHQRKKSLNICSCCLYNMADLCNLSICLGTRVQKAQNQHKL